MLRHRVEGKVAVMIHFGSTIADSKMSSNSFCTDLHSFGPQLHHCTRLRLETPLSRTPVLLKAWRMAACPHGSPGELGRNFLRNLVISVSYWGGAGTNAVNGTKGV